MQRGEKQVVRVALRGAPDQKSNGVSATGQRSARPGTFNDAGSSGFRVALRMDLPLLVAPLQAAKADATYSTILRTRG